MKRLLLIVTVCLFTKNSMAQAPGGISANITLWLKANTNVPANISYNASSKVSNWKSEVGAHQVSQLVATRQPQFFNNPSDSANFNFNPFIQFTRLDSTTLFNASTAPDLLGTTGTIFLVSNKNNPVGSGSQLTYRSNSNYRFQIKPSFRLQNGALGTGYKFELNGLPGAIINYPDRSAFILTSLSTGMGSKARRNATDFGAPTGNSATFFPSVQPGLFISGNGSNGEMTNMAVAEIIFYNTTLTGTDLIKVESYLAMKYGISLDEITGQLTNYLSSNGTVVWEKTVALGYNENITAIGRDDASGFYQKQAKSVNDGALLTVFNAPLGSANFPVMNDSNQSTIPVDNAFFMFGDNKGDTALTICINNGYQKRMQRIWKVQKTVSFFDTYLRYDGNIFPGVKKLLVSGDSTFAPANTSQYNITNAGQYNYIQQTIGNNGYFTFASDSMLLPQLQAADVCQNANGTATVINPVPGAVYNWYSMPTGGILIGTGTSIIIPGLLNDTTIYVSAISPFNCLLPTRVAVTIRVSVVATPLANILQPTCLLNTGTITVTAPLGPGYQYCINGSNCQAALIFSNLSPGLYQVTAVNGLGCISPVFTVTVNPQPALPAAPQVNASVIICPDETAALQVLNPVPGQIYKWYTSLAATNPVGTGILYTTPVLSAPTTYYVEAVNAQGCISPRTAVNVQVKQKLLSPVVSVTLITDSSLLFNWTAVPGANRYLVSVDGVNYTIPSSGQNGTSHLLNGLLANTTHTLFVKAIDSLVLCITSNDGTATGRTLKKYDDVFVPSAFTPNGDQLNNTLQVYGDISNYQFSIFNRYGQLIFYTTTLNQGWDGKFKGKDQSSGVYVWYVKAKLTDGRTVNINGSSILIR